MPFPETPNWKSARSPLFTWFVQTSLEAALRYPRAVSADREQVVAGADTPLGRRVRVIINDRTDILRSPGGYESLEDNNAP